MYGETIQAFTDCWQTSELVCADRFYSNRKVDVEKSTNRGCDNELQQILNPQMMGGQPIVEQGNNEPIG